MDENIKILLAESIFLSGSSAKMFTRKKGRHRGLIPVPLTQHCHCLYSLGHHDLKADLRHSVEMNCSDERMNTRGHSSFVISIILSFKYENNLLSAVCCEFKYQEIDEIINLIQSQLSIFGTFITKNETNH